MLTWDHQIDRSPERLPFSGHYRSEFHFYLATLGECEDVEYEIGDVLMMAF